MISSKLKFSEYMLNISRSNVFGKNFLIVYRSNNFWNKIPFFKSYRSMKNYPADFEPLGVELVSKELNHLAAILHVYAGGLNFMK